MTKNIKLTQEAISVKYFFIIIIPIIIISSVLLGIAAVANNFRAQTVIADYTQETRIFVNKNQEQIKQLFTQTMDSCNQQLQEKNEDGKSQYVSRSFDCPAAKTNLDAINKNNLKDPSAMVYMRLKQDEVEFVKASGEYTRPISINSHSDVVWNQRNQLKFYLIDHKKIKLWDNFLYTLPQKQVIVPVEIDGQIIGYIFRGVIER